MRWASALDTREALLPIVSSWAGQATQVAGQALSGLPDEGYKQRLVDTVATQWAGTEPIEARAWVEKLEPSVRNGAATALVESLLQREPERAADWALALSDGPTSEIVEKTLTAWVARDADAALNWASEQPRGRRPRPAHGAGERALPVARCTRRRALARGPSAALSG